MVSIPNAKGVVAQHADAPAVSVLDGGDHYIKRRQLPFQLQPGLSAPPRGVGGFGIFDHQAFVAAGLGSVEEAIEFVRR